MHNLIKLYKKKKTEFSPKCIMFDTRKKFLNYKQRTCFSCKVLFLFAVSQQEIKNGSVSNCLECHFHKDIVFESITKGSPSWNLLWTCSTWNAMRNAVCVMARWSCFMSGLCHDQMDIAGITCFMARWDQCQMFRLNVLKSLNLKR